MTLNSGLNLLYPTIVSKSRLILDEDKMILPALERNEISDTLKEVMVDEFDDYLSHMGKSLSDWHHYQVKSWVNKYVFYDPRNFASRGYDLQFRPMFEPTVYHPKQGDVLVFPSFLYHGVRPTQHLRVSAAFDLYLFNDV